MALPTLEKDISYISKLADQPNDTTGSNLSAAELKSRFDTAGEDIKEFLNGTLIPYLESVNAAASFGILEIPGVDATNIQAALESLKAAIDNAAVGGIPDSSLAGSKLMAQAVTNREIAPLAIEGFNVAKKTLLGDNFADETVGELQLAPNAVNTKQLAPKAVVDDNIADKTINAAMKIAEKSIVEANYGEQSLPTGAIKPKAVTPDKLDRTYADLDGNGKINAEQASARIKTINTSAYTLSKDDIGVFLNVVVSCTITIPSDTSYEEFPHGIELEIYRENPSNKLTFALGNASGVFKSKDGSVTTVAADGENAVVVLKRLSSAAWLAKGDTA